MLYGVIDGLRRVDPATKFSVLTTYPKADRAEIDGAAVLGTFDSSGVELFDLSPLKLLSAFITGTFARIALAMHLPPCCLKRSGPLRAILDADVVVDIAGISFVDGRGMALLAYNVLMTGLPVLLGKPTIKASQALGPMRTVPTKTAAQVVLPRLTAICARGAVTRGHLEELGLDNIVDTADVAFGMDSGDDTCEPVTRAWAARTGGKIAIMPSSVVQQYCEKIDIDYVTVMADVINSITASADTSVLLAPHSWRDGDVPGRLNDGPVVREIADAARDSGSVVVMEDSIDPRCLRSIISESDILITSRFHAMVSALATETPVLVVGWSHKYGEVLDQFGLGEWAVDYSGLTDDVIIEQFERLVEQSDEVSDTIKRRLPEVTLSSLRNIEVIEESIPVAPIPVPATDLGPVIEHGWCIGCGVCTVADPSISLELDPVRQMFLPTAFGDERVASICPAVRVDFDRLHREVFPDAEVTEFGVVDSVWLAQSTDTERNIEASSGGLIKELLRSLLNNEEVDGAIALQHTEGVEFEPTMLREPDEVDGLPGSIYHNLNQQRALELLRSEPGKYVLVGIPCHLEGIYQYILEYEPELLDRIYTTIGLICGWQYNRHSILAMCEFFGVDPDTIEDIAYRGGGPVGKLRIATTDGEEHTASRRVDFSYQVAFDRHFNLPRCHVCINHSNFLADIVVGDAWLPSTLFTKTGVSLVIARSDDSRALLNDLVSSGRIVTSEVSTEEIRESQTDRIVFGDMAYSYSGYLDQLGVQRPVMDGPNKARTSPLPLPQVEHFHSEHVKKTELQEANKYQRLRVRKATVEAPEFAKRYLRWFFVRVVRVKSLTGKRNEVSHSQLDGFR